MNTQNTTEAIEAPQGDVANESPERAILREIIVALDLPWHANYEDRNRRMQLLSERVALIRGYMIGGDGATGAVDEPDMSPYVGHLTQIIAQSMPVTYAVKGGDVR